MKILFYFPSALVAPHFGVLLDEAEIMFRNGHEVYFATCDNVLDVCIMNNQSCNSICKLCHWRTKNDLKLLSQDIHVLHLKDYVGNVAYNNSFSYHSMSDMKKIEYKGVKIGFAVLSSYITLTRNIDPVFDDKLRKHLDKCLQVSIRLTDAFENLLNSLHPDKVCTFNGRFYETRPVFELSKMKGYPVCCYEVRGGFGEDFYKVKFENNLPHDIRLNMQMIEDCWNDGSKSLEEKIKKGSSFFENRRNGKPAGDKIYIKDQKKGAMPDDWDDSKRNVAIFNSSEDEFMAVSEEYDQLALFPSQIEGIRSILTMYKDDKSFHFYLRIHPNLKDIKYKYHTDLHKLSEEFNNVTVIPGDSIISSYDLMEHAEKVIVFGSTMGMESVYWKKPVILLAGALYTYMDICYKPTSMENLKELIASNLEPKENLPAIKIGYYLMHRDERAKYTFFDFNLWRGSFFGHKFTYPKYEKIMRSNMLYALFSAFRHRLYNLSNLFGLFSSKAF